MKLKSYTLKAREQSFLACLACRRQSFREELTSDHPAFSVLPLLFAAGDPLSVAASVKSTRQICVELPGSCLIANAVWPHVAL